MTGKISILHPGEALLFYRCHVIHEGLSWHNAQELLEEVMGISKWVGHKILQTAHIMTVLEGNMEIINKVKPTPTGW